MNDKKKGGVTGVFHVNEFNSTTFTDCCSVAIMSEANCPSCGESVIYHDLEYESIANARFRYAMEHGRRIG